MPEQPELVVPDAAAWRTWLEENHATSDGVWLVLSRRKSTATTALTYAEALDEALCFGWIDSQVRRRDETSGSQRFTPRRSRSPWSARNVGIVARLEAEGRMTEAGRAEVRRAQDDGRWDRAYGGPATLAVPDDLTAALDAEPRARRMFDVLTSQNRFAVVYRVEEAVRPETRARRIAQHVEMLARGETPFPQKARPDGG
ncbi:YdeI/OmpD-associated family protein [Cellulomonas carbonis]|uniref:Bacteriocin-protection protein, YdeI/OmpD-associated family n=1 Tax=Cellulomonas carbonis T26 TaxID=947969 RepID=A0A0A0BUB1_9CELL|nr:YdeI/OmpD-associated family protein [Cellulomonas carbonis]KGM11570.1 hypothetical protein N868_05435 [Cellulomonas carbonis T26]GGC06741.1 hypothetical protein GCM10010972_20000 [Cellulomonas carbonis]